jgi:hypothetical protein
MSNIDCDESNGYPYLLTEPPEEDELPKNYFGSFGFGDEEVEDEVEDEIEEVSSTTQQVVEYINNLITHSRISFYIEPFVGDSETIDKIEGVSTILGTDLNPEKVEEVKERMRGSSKTFRACDYKTWNKPLLSKDYKGKCIVFCDIPENSETFSVEEFVEIAKEWAKNNKIVVRSSKLKRRHPELILGDNDFLYRI